MSCIYQNNLKIQGYKQGGILLWIFILLCAELLPAWLLLNTLPILSLCTVSVSSNPSCSKMLIPKV